MHVKFAWRAGRNLRTGFSLFGAVRFSCADRLRSLLRRGRTASLLDECRASLGWIGAAAQSCSSTSGAAKYAAGLSACAEKIRLFHGPGGAAQPWHEKARLRASHCAAPLAPAAVINVEFKFTPFSGDPAKDETVTTVPGKAAVFINNVPFTEQEVREEEVPVLFEQHEVAAAVWVPMSSVGPVVRKGKNKIRIEFTPNDTTKTYRAQLRWASVMDEDHGGNRTGQPPGHQPGQCRGR